MAGEEDTLTSRFKFPDCVCQFAWTVGLMLWSAPAWSLRAWLRRVERVLSSRTPPTPPPQSSRESVSCAATLRLPPHHTNPNFHPILNGQAVHTQKWIKIAIFSQNSQFRPFYQAFGGRCQVVGGRCQVVGGRCQVVGGRCQVVGGRCQVVGRRYQVVGRRCQVVGRRWQVVGRR